VTLPILAQANLNYICKKIKGDGKSLIFNNLTKDNKLLNIYEIEQIWGKSHLEVFSRVDTITWY